MQGKYRLSHSEEMNIRNCRARFVKSPVTKTLSTARIN